MLPPSSRPPDAATMATGPYHSARVRGWHSPLQPCRQRTAGHRRQRKPHRARPGQKQGQGGGCRRGRGGPGQPSEEGGEEARWSRPASSRCCSCFRSLIMGDWGAALAARVLPSRSSPASLRRCRRPPPHLSSAQSLRSGASLPGERPGEAPGSCSGSLSLPRRELRRRERAGKPRPGGRGGGTGRRRDRSAGRPRARRGRVRRPLSPRGAAGTVPFGGGDRKHLRAVCGAWKRGGKCCSRSGRPSLVPGGLPGLRLPAAAGYVGGERSVLSSPPWAFGGRGVGGLAGATGTSQWLAAFISERWAGGRNFPSLLKKDSRQTINQNFCYKLI